MVFVPAFAGLGAPHWDPFASGLLIGMHRGTTAGHIARAALESIAFQVADVLLAMQSENGQSIGELRVDGGAAANNLLLQFQADLLGVPVIRPATIETTALGAAYLAGLATGFWSGVEEIQSTRTTDTRFEPRADRSGIASSHARWREAVERSKGWNRP
uniref:Glycerol kinase (ATP:glycerol 3-phosphotransferase) (Glycerokinase) (GK) n=1 Tax=mine drainage metagenome TaxID=410659 RepID=E6QL83_9ZZZZ